MNKTDFNSLFEKYQPFFKKTGEELSKVVKKAEEDISKMYKIAESHVELQMKNLQKEKLYHEIGKYVAQQLIKNEFDASSLEKYRKNLEKIASEDEKIKNKLARITRAKKS